MLCVLQRLDAAKSLMHEDPDIKDCIDFGEDNDSEVESEAESSSTRARVTLGGSVPNSDAKVSKLKSEIKRLKMELKSCNDLNKAFSEDLQQVVSMVDSDKPITASPRLTYGSRRGSSGTTNMLLELLTTAVASWKTKVCYAAMEADCRR